MTRNHRPARIALLAIIGALALGLAACGPEYPNSTFHRHTDFNTDIDALWDKLLFWGTLVFVVVEAVLLYTIFKFRDKAGNREAKHVHGNATLEIVWTAIPAVILIIIAIPTVRTIFKTQAKAAPGALQVEVVGHQWWWEFRYPQYTTRSASGKLDTLTVANELYIPLGRTVNFTLHTADVIHSFWIPGLGGKRDVMPNHDNFLWFTPADSLGTSAYNGHCAEFCGASHANMKFRTFAVKPDEFESWVKLQQSPAAFNTMAPAAPPVAIPAALPAGTPPPGAATAATAVGVSRAPDTATPAVATTPAPAPSAGTNGFVFPKDKLPPHVMPHTPVPTGLTFNTALVGDPARGEKAFVSCIGCHMVKGNPMAMGRIGPNLTHVGTRTSIGAGLYPNDTQHLALWIKNARLMKPGILMPTLGKGQRDPVTGVVVPAAGLDDQQIADIVAYLQALK
jgi:cytochrome c oxidase subunit 2